MLDASRAVGVVSNLLSDETARGFVSRGVRDEYQDYANSTPAARSPSAW